VLTLPKVEQFTLKNGLTVYVVPQPGFDTVAIRYIGRRSAMPSDFFDVRLAGGGGGRRRGVVVLV
jgi:hypothetical protein